MDTAYDRVLPLSTDQSPLTMERYDARVAAWRYLASFSHMPGMLKNHRKFIDLARDPALLQHVRHVPGRKHLREDLPGATCLWFWALVFVALQDDDAANELVARLVDEPLPGGLAPVRTTLVRYLEASDRPVLATALAVGEPGRPEPGRPAYPWTCRVRRWTCGSTADRSELPGDGVADGTRTHDNRDHKANRNELFKAESTSYRQLSIESRAEET